MTSAITTSFKQIFKEAGDNSSHVGLLIPATVRFKFYPTREDVILENKFAAMTLQVPLTESMDSAYS